jgi:hypothetical protein
VGNRLESTSEHSEKDGEANTHAAHDRETGSDARPARAAIGRGQRGAAVESLGMAAGNGAGQGRESHLRFPLMRPARDARS